MDYAHASPRRDRHAALRAAAVTVLALAACTDGVSPEQEGPISQLPRELTVSEQVVIEASNEFGLGLFGRVVANDARPNVVLSPLSASMALGMTLNGAEGSTFDAMRSTLAFGSLTRADVNASYRELIDILTDLDPRVEFAIANAIWANENVPFHQAFFDVVAAAFDARTESRNFSDPATLAAINGWVSDRTGGLIDSIVDGLDPTLVMLLVNAIYFDAAWTHRFDAAKTRPQAFTRADGSAVQVDMMSMEGVELPRSFGPSYQAVELPYGGGAFSMVVVLPDSNTGARALASSLDPDAWGAIVDGLSPSRLDLLSLPKLTLEYDQYLNDALKAMGMGVAFGGAADFSRMSPVGQDLCISFVRQKTFVEVDERGTRAAAVTGVGIGIVSFNGLIVNRPFLFAIRERLSGTILFVGLVEDPTAAPAAASPPAVECG